MGSRHYESLHMSIPMRREPSGTMFTSSNLYEAKIKNMGNAGEYFTPRRLIRAIVAVTEPKLGETICDPAVGSAGFLCESFDYALEALKKSLLHQAFTGEF